MEKIIFIGSEAEGYRSGAYACRGVFIAGEVYAKYSNVLGKLFESNYFHDLDGKHSEVEGDQVFKTFDGYGEIAKFMDKVDDYGYYLIDEELYEVEEDELEEEEKEAIVEHVKELTEQIEREIMGYEEVSFYLKKVQATEVRKFIERLSK